LLRRPKALEPKQRVNASVDRCTTISGDIDNRPVDPCIPYILQLIPHLFHLGAVPRRAKPIQRSNVRLCHGIWPACPDERARPLQARGWVPGSENLCRQAAIVVQLDRVRVCLRAERLRTDGNQADKHNDNVSLHLSVRVR
jgi:hypothetical protein